MALSACTASRQPPPSAARARRLFQLGQPLPHARPGVPAKDAAQRGLDATKDAAQHAGQAAKDLYQSAASRAEDIYHSAAARAEDTLVQSKQYVRENPVPVVLGAFAVGLTLGCLMGLSHHHEPTLRERFRW